MLSAAEEAHRRRPLEFLHNIFKKRRDHEEGGELDPNSHDINFEGCNFYNQSWVDDSEGNLSTHDFQSPSRMTPHHLSPVMSSVNSSVVGGSCHIPTVATITTAKSPIRSSIMIATATIGIPLVPSAGGSFSPNTLSPSYLSPHTNSQPMSPAVLSSCASPIILHRTPIKQRDIGEDMEAIRLSRQDNPYLQKVTGSQLSLTDDGSANGPAMEETDTTHLVSQSGSRDDAMISLSQIHEHLIRSPPPTSVPKTLTGRGIFIFPTEDQFLGNKVATYSGKGQTLNPVVSKGHEDVLDQNLRQILNTQRKLPTSKEAPYISTSVPGSPARVPSQVLPLHPRKATHSKTYSDEYVYPLGATSLREGPTSSEPMNILAPLLPSGRKHSTNRTPFAKAPSLTPPLKPPIPIGLNVADVAEGGTSPISGSLTLPIRAPFQPASPKIT